MNKKSFDDSYCILVECIMRLVFVSSIIREQWIRGKYERLEFASHRQFVCEGKVGHLWKKGKDGPRFAPRRFVLSVLDNSLSYFVHEQVSMAAILWYTEPSEYSPDSGIQFWGSLL